MSQMNLNPHLFKEYDIRGIVEKDIPPEIVTNIGKALGTFYQSRNKRTIYIGRDVRLTSDSLFKYLSEGLILMGCNVIDIGTCTTPMLYFAVFQNQADGGVMITGSHNAKEYNGFKMLIGRDCLYGEQIQELKKTILDQSFKRDGKPGSLTKQDISQDYEAFFIDQFKDLSGLKVVIDAGNATGGLYSVQTLRKLGCTVFPIFCEVDGNFPNHHPDPTVPKNLKALQSEVLNQKADVGIAFDGDADRIGVVNEQGQIVFADDVMVLYSRELLRRKPGSVIIAEVKSSQNLFRDIEEKGGKPLMWKTGHSLIKAKMKETKAELAGELTGHIFFQDRFFGYDDAFYATCRLLEILKKESKPLSELLSDLTPLISTPEIRVDFSDDSKFKVVKKISDYFTDQGLSVNTVDGVRVEFDQGWGLIRPSNTSPCLVMRFEATSQDKLEEYQNLFNDTLDKFKKETV